MAKSGGGSDSPFNRIKRTNDAGINPPEADK
jgi:hypothetical protein